MKRLVIGTRGSPLAMWQANFVRDCLLSHHKGLEIELRIIKTQGDKVMRTVLDPVLDKGMFTKEIQSALLEESIDLAVHSLKDLPTDAVEGLSLAAVMAREDPADVLVSKGALTLEQLPTGAKVLSGSLRRKALLLAARDDLTVAAVRGNVGTRLRKFDESDAHAIVFARAGMVRLDLIDRVSQRLDPAEFLPACGQGALGIEIRSPDAGVAALLGPLEDFQSRAATAAERSFLAALGGGCQIPAGAYGKVTGAQSTSPQITITGMVAALDGARIFRHTVSGPLDGPATAEAIGRRLAEMVLDAGGREILDEIRGSAGAALESDS